MIILHLDSCDSDIKYALDNFLREKGFSVEHHDIGKLCFLNAVAGASAIEQPPAEQPVEEPSVDPGTMPSPSADLPAYEPEVDLQVQAPDEVTNVPSPEPLAKHYVSGELIVRNLSAECKIPFDINPDNYMASELHVQNLTVENDFASFTYCGMQVKVPVLSTPGIINVLLQIGEQNLTATLNLVAANECRVIIGADMISNPIISALYGKDDSNDKVPAQ